VWYCIAAHAVAGNATEHGFIRLPIGVISSAR
jgi:hypothetical protein